MSLPPTFIAHRSSHLLLVGLTALLLGAAAPRAARGATEDSKAAARALALEGTRSADSGDHEKALLLFRDAYTRYQEPAYLYDIAVEYQTLGRDADAISAYERFLADPRNTPQEFVTHATQQRDEIQARLPAKKATEIAVAPPLPDDDTQERTALKRRIAWQVAPGAVFWTSGMRGNASPSPAFSVGAGYLVAALPGDFDLRLGGKLAFTYFKDLGATDTLFSMLANPTLSRRLSAELTVFGEVGVGLLVLSGVPNNSELLDPQGNRVTGALAAFELRPGLGVSYAITDSLALYASPSFVWNPSPNTRFAFPALSRVEMSLGVSGGI